MNSKVIEKKLEKLGYTLSRMYPCWIVTSIYTGYTWKFNNLTDVNGFVVQESYEVV